MEKIRFKEKRDFSEIINAAFGFIKQEFPHLSKVLLFSVAPVALAFGIFVHYLINYVINLFQMINNPDASPESMILSFFLSLGLTFISYFIATIMSSAVTFAYIKVYVDEGPNIKIELKNLLKWVKWDFWRLLLAAIVLAIIGFFIQIFVNLFPIIGIFIYIIISFFITAITYLIYMIMVYERKKFFKAFSRSFDLITDFWWKSFALVAVTMIIQMSLALSVAAPSGIAYGIYIYHTVKSVNDAAIHYSPLMNVTSAVFTVLASILVFLLQAITLIAMAFHYFSLVESKEGPGLLEEIGKIGSTQLVDEKMV